MTEAVYLVKGLQGLKGNKKQHGDNTSLLTSGLYERTAGNFSQKGSNACPTAVCPQKGNKQKVEKNRTSKLKCQMSCLVKMWLAKLSWQHKRPVGFFHFKIPEN